MLGTVPVQGRVNVVRLHVSDAGQGMNQPFPLLAEESSGSTSETPLACLM